MAIVKRTVKGSDLTYEELDGNFDDLDGRVTAAQATADAAAAAGGAGTGLATGDVLFSLQSAPPSGFVSAGSIQLIATYPDLSSMIPAVATPVWADATIQAGNASFRAFSDDSGTLIAVGYQGVERSTDGGLTWTASTGSPNVAPNGTGQFIASGGGKSICLVDTQYAWMSSDQGNSWTLMSPPDFTYAGGVAYGGGVWLLGGGDATTTQALYRSTDNGATWNNVSTDHDGYGLAYIDGEFMMCGVVDKHLYTSPDGLAWTQKGLPVAANGFGRICKAAGALIVACDDSRLYRSTDDGVTWSQIVDLSPGNWPAGLCSDGATALVVFDSTGDVFESADGGATWSAADLSGVTADPSGYYGVGYAGGKFLLGGVDEKIYHKAGLGYDPATQFAVPAIAAPSNTYAYVKAS